MSPELYVEDMHLHAWIKKQALKLTALDANSPAFSPALIDLAMTLKPNTPSEEVIAAKAAGWALAARRPEITGIDAGVTDLVTSLVAEGPPEECPTLLKDGACFVRTRCNKPLLGPVRAVSLYRALDAWYITTFEERTSYTLWVNGYRFELDWAAKSLDDAVIEAKYQGAFPGLEHLTPAQREQLLPTQRERDAVMPALRWLLALAVLLDARGTPLKTEDGGSAERLIRPKRYHSARGVAYRTVRVSKSGVRTSAPVDHTISLTYEEADRLGLVKEEVYVQPFVRRQACGRNNSERRWIFVGGHKSTRWKRPDMLTKTTVKHAPDEEKKP